MERPNEAVSQQPSRQMPEELEHRPTITEVVKTGKVRNIHAFSGFVFETSNRLSVFDRVIKEDVPLKGAMLNCISQYNKQLLNQCGFVTDYIPVPNSFYAAAGFDTKDFGRLSYGQMLTMLPFEFIVRGYLVGSAYKAYKNGEPYCGFTFPDGLKEGDKLPRPILTPTTKEENGHDKPVTKQECIEMLAVWLLDNELVADAQDLREMFDGDYEACTAELNELIDEEDKNFGKESSEDKWEQAEYAVAYAISREYIGVVYDDSLDAYNILSKRCAEAGILFIDTKFEFGLSADDDIVLADEVGTPDSSRFASAEEYEKSGKIVSYDKQIVRDYCKAIGFTGDNDQPIPDIPEEVWEKVTSTYVFIAEQLCGEDVVAQYK